MTTETFTILLVAGLVFAALVGAVVGSKLTKRNQLARYRNEVRKYAAQMEIIKREHPQTTEDGGVWLRSLDQRTRCTIAENNARLVGMRIALGLTFEEGNTIVQVEWGKRPQGVWGTVSVQH